ncbi:CRISPR-associated protein Csx19 [Candidatus Acidulodesulfobacterium sp. H_13]|uniref:type III-D CRISPR-associated protein Csx19 n=1 Tax=Candidatus Acidulodesulfobacterium sp. H_13 TaxID=3395470 RepID=UPI003AF59370
MNRIENGLKWTSIKSSTKTKLILEDIKEIKGYIKGESNVVAYLDNEVLIGRYDGNFSFPEDKRIEKRFIRRLRIFNKDEELHLWRSNGRLNGRYRSDSEGEETYAIEANQVIFGTKAEICNEYTILTEQRGTKITIPGKWETDNKRMRVAIKTRHYIGYKNGYQAAYVDVRFVKFVQLPLMEGER